MYTQIIKGTEIRKGNKIFVCISLIYSPPNYNYPSHYEFIEKNIEKKIIKRPFNYIQDSINEGIMKKI